MVSLLLSRGLRTKEDNEKSRKREKRNEIQCMILFKPQVFGSTKSEICSYFEFYFLFLNLEFGDETCTGVNIFLIGKVPSFNCKILFFVMLT